MIIFINNNSTKFCQITLRIKRFLHKRKVIPFFWRTVYIRLYMYYYTEPALYSNP